MIIVIMVKGLDTKHETAASDRFGKSPCDNTGKRLRDEQDTILKTSDMVNPWGDMDSDEVWTSSKIIQMNNQNGDHQSHPYHVCNQTVQRAPKQERKMSRWKVRISDDMETECGAASSVSACSWETFKHDRAELSTMD